MARLKLEFPENVLFNTMIKVRITDINYGGHLGNDALLSLIHQARVDFFHSIQASELNLFGTSVIMSDVMIQYRNEAFAGDELIFEITFNDIALKSFDIWYRISKTSNNNTITVAVAKTGMVCYNYTTKKTENVPQQLIDLVK